ncbi:MAG: tRNA pseudouridine(38-40) synthase TruA [Bacteroidales bacterium]|nr:tRNA pseudouridine(38-40) synthase TruA [Bacteroidales bacterium]
MRYFIHLAYNGSHYFGWQIQHREISVQQTITQAFSTLLKQEIAITGAGRTDTGVHASSYYAHFDIDKCFSKEEIEQLVYRLNGFLPKDIVIYSIFPVALDAHARFSAMERTYRYYVTYKKNPFVLDRAYRIFYQPDIENMNRCCQELYAHTDFSAFSKSNTDTKTNDCTITQAVWMEKGDLLVFEITANRFLRNMVRAIVGTLLEVGKKNLTKEDFREIILSKNRSKAGISVPAHALFLENVRYPFI